MMQPWTTARPLVCVAVAGRLQRRLDACRERCWRRHCVHDGQGRRRRAWRGLAAGAGGRQLRSRPKTNTLSTCCCNTFTGSWREIERERRSCQAGRLVGCEGDSWRWMFRYPLLKRHDVAVGPDQSGMMGRRVIHGQKRQCWVVEVGWRAVATDGDYRLRTGLRLTVAGGRTWHLTLTPAGHLRMREC
jgi:hypothetical protein